MKNCCRYILLVLFLFTGADLFASVYNGGLYFKSHSAPSVDRTSLTLNDDKPFDVSNEFTISFQMWVRNNEPDFRITTIAMNTSGLLILNIAFIYEYEPISAFFICCGRA